MELLRVFKNKKFLAAVILLLLLNCVSFYITQKKSIEDFGGNIHVYSEVFNDNSDVFSKSDAEDFIIESNNKFQILKSFADMEKMKAENSEEYEYFAGEEALLIQENPSIYQEYKDGKYSFEELAALNDFYSHFAYQAEYQKNYQYYINSILENGRELSSKKLFANENSFSYKSIERSIKDFEKNKNVELSLVNDLPVSAVLNSQTGDFILVLICIFSVVAFAPGKNVDLLINTCKNGRRMLKLKQIPILLSLSLVSSFIIFATEILISFKIYNAPLNLYIAIQSSDMFSDCILHINFLQLFAMFIVFKALVAVLLSLLIWTLISLSNNIILVSGIAGVITGAELVFYKNISEQSTISFLKTFNLFSLLDYKSITEYNLISIFGTPVRADTLIWVVVIAVAFLFCALIIMSTKQNYPVKSPSKVFSLLGRTAKKFGVAYSKLQSLVYAGRFETFKIMHIGKGLLIFSVFVIVLLLSFNTNSLSFTSTEAFLNDYYEEYGGELNTAVYDSIDKMQTEAQNVEKEFEIKSRQFADKKISFEEYELARAKNAAYDTQRKAVEVLKAQVERIEALSEQGIKPVLINEAGYNNLFSLQSNQNEMLLLICAIIIMFSSVFSIEKSSNMLFLNRCSKKGRENLYLKKIFAVVPKTFLLTLLSYLYVIIQVKYLYGIDYLNSDIHNLQVLQGIDLKISIFEYLLINFLFEFLFITVVALIAVSLSVFMSQLAVIIISASLFVLPGALYMVNINSTKEISSVFLFNFNSFVLDKGINANGFVVQMVLIIVCIVMLYLCKRKWCLTKGR